MKKIIITVALVTFAMASQAQIFVGGQLGFRSYTESNTPKDKDKEKELSITRFNIAPTIGYQLNEKLAVGVRIDFLTRKQTNFDEVWVSSDKYEDLVRKNSGFGFEVFGQYTFLNLDKLFVYAEAGIGFGTGKATREAGSVEWIKSEEKITNFGINIVPVLGYNLTERITLLANLNFMSLGFNSVTEEDVKTKNKTHISDFGLNINSNNITRGGILFQVGCIYRF